MLGRNVLISALATTLIVAACGGNSSTASSQKKNVGLIIVAASFVGAGVHKGVDQEAAKAGWNVVFLSPNGNAQLEAQDIQQLITRHVDVILYAPSDSTVMTTQVQKVIDAKIPIVCFDTCVDNAQQMGVKGMAVSDAEALGMGAGKGLGDYINEKLGGNAKVGLITCEVVSLCKLRRDGLLKGIASTGAKITIVAEQETYVQDVADKDTTNMLTAHPDIQMVISESASGMDGVHAAIKRSGRHVVTGGSDFDPTLAQDMISGDGIVVAADSQDPVTMGSAAMRMGIDAAAGKSISPWEQLIPGIPFSYKDLGAVQAWLTANPPVTG